MRFIISFLFPLLIISNLVAQKTAIRHIEEQMFADSIAHYKATYQNVESVNYLYEPIYIAISYYPNLENAQIKFREKKMKTTMAARPSTFFFSAKKLSLIQNFG